MKCLRPQGVCLRLGAKHGESASRLKHARHFDQRLRYSIQCCLVVGRLGGNRADAAIRVGQSASVSNDVSCAKSFQPKTQRRIDVHAQDSAAACLRFQDNAADSREWVEQESPFSNTCQVHKQSGVVRGQSAAAERLPVAAIACHRAYSASRRFEQENAAVGCLIADSLNVFTVNVGQKIVLTSPLDIIFRSTGNMLQHIHRVTVAEAGQAFGGFFEGAIR